MTTDFVYSPEDVRTARRCFSRAGAGLAVMIAITYGLTLLGAYFIRQISPALLENTWIPWIIQYGALYLIALPVCLLILQPVPHSAPPGGLLSWKHLPIVFPICIFVMYTSNIITLLLNRFLADNFGLHTGNPVEDVFMDMGLVQRILIPVIIAPVMEELIFRKILIDRMHVYGERIAVVTSAVMFGLFHGNLSQVLYATTLGLILGYVYLRSGKLRYPVILHMMINSIAAILASVLIAAGHDFESLNALQETMQGADPADPAAIQEMVKLFTPALLAIMMIIMVLFSLFLAGIVLLIVFFRKIRFFQAPYELPKGRRFSTVWLNIGMILFLLAAIGEFVYYYSTAAAS